MTELTKSRIAILQNNLPLIRKLMCWSAAELGNKIGVTKQTVSNLENHKTEMTKTQYIAIRAVLDYEINYAENSITKAEIVAALLDIDNLSKVDQVNIKTAVSFLFGSVDKDMDELTVKKVINPIFDRLRSTPEILSAMAFAKTTSYSWIERIND